MLHFTTTTVSTQDDLHALAAAGAVEGTAVIAAEQRAGRGSRGRSWASPLGGLWMSVLCRPATAPALEVLSLRIALAACTGLEAAVVGLRLGIKWPNDLILRDRKLGGILCEARWQGGTVGWVAVGIGLNVMNPIPPELSAQAINLVTSGPSPSPGDLAARLAALIVGASQASGPLTQAELEMYQRRDWLTGRVILEPAIGVARGISPQGELQVASVTGLVSLYRSGTVRIDPGSAGENQAG